MVGPGPTDHGAAAVDDVARLLADARAIGWPEAYYQHCLREVVAGRSVDDERVADWRFLLPSRPATVALVIGCGLGTMACALAASCAKVYVADSDPRRLELLHLRQDSLGLSNIQGIQVLRPDDMPFMENALDLIVFRSSDWSPACLSLEHVVSRSRALLRTGGHLALTVANRWSFSRLGHGARRTTCAVSLRGCERMLRASGFAAVRMHAIIPDHDVMPLFWIPLGDGRTFHYFLASLSGLLDLASPEARSRYESLRHLAKLGARLALKARLTPLSQHFVPAFGVLAEAAEVSLSAW